MKKVIFTLVLITAVVFSTSAQVRTLTGTVLSSEDGLPLIGANVVIKGTTYGTITDVNGTFQLSYGGTGDVLEISYIGMETMEMPITDSDTYDVTMNPGAIGLGEVVVTALGITREKKTLGYAVQDVSGDDLNQAKDMNIVNSMSGKIAGVQVTSGGSTVGASSRVVIRGNASFADNQPLFVIDGTPIDNSTTNLDGSGGIDWGNAAADIDPNNIETMTVLKGANATALYGSRATNGVILITTKKGNEGRKLGVDFNSSVIIDRPSYFPAFQNEYGGGDRGSEYYWQKDHPEMTYQDYAKQYGYNWVDGQGGGVNDGWPINWGPRLDAGLKLDQWSTGPNSDWVSRPDNFKSDYFRNGVNIENSLAVSATGDKAFGRLSYTNRNTAGIIEFTDQKQNTLNTSVTVMPTDKVTASANITYLRKESDNIPNNGYSGAIVDAAWVQRDFDMLHFRELYDESGNDEPGLYGNWMDNPFYVLDNLTGFTRDRVFGNGSLTYQMTDWLSVIARAGLDFYNEYRKDITHAGTWGNIGSGRGGQFNQTQLFNKEVNADLILRFDKVFGDIRVDGLVGANYRNDEYKQMYMRASDLTVPDLFTISNVSGTPTISMYDYMKETNSVYAAANFSYKDFLFLGVTGRNDWSSTLPAESRSYFYPSVSLGFSVIDAFQLESDVLSYAKLRASWAKVGGDTGPYQLDRTYSAGTYNAISIFRPTGTLPPVDLLPEETKSFELGADVRLWRDRLVLDLTYYNQTTVNQILSVATSTATGYSAMRLNAGEVSNSGVEIMLNSRAVTNPSGFTWDITLNWAKNKSMVNELYGDLESYVISDGFGGCKTLGIPDEEWGILWGLPFRRNDAGKIIVNDNGVPTTTNEGAALGSVTPDWVGGIRNSFRFKGVNLSFLLDGRMGGDFFSCTAWHSYFTGSYEVTVKDNVRETGLIVDGVREDGSVNDIRVSAQDYYMGSWMWNNHEYSIIDGSYIKLRELVLGYDFNVSNLSWIYKLNVSFVGRNLALLYRSEDAKLHGIDPEVGLGGGEGGLGFENFQIPTTRSYGVRLSVSF
jgi:TonB-linked SusC/RagA family outer membrane protein